MDDIGLRITLTQRGYRVTSQRLAILKIVYQNNEKFLSADEIFLEVKHAVPGIGISTVYKNLNVLEKEGLLYKFKCPDKISRYEICDDKNVHCHLICLRCGKIIKFNGPYLGKLCTNLKNSISFYLVNSNIMLYGYCLNCKARLMKTE